MGEMGPHNVMEQLLWSSPWSGSTVKCLPGWTVNFPVPADHRCAMSLEQSFSFGPCHAVPSHDVAQLTSV